MAARTQQVAGPGRATCSIRRSSRALSSSAGVARVMQTGEILGEHQVGEIWIASSSGEPDDSEPARNSC